MEYIVTVWRSNICHFNAKADCLLEHEKYSIIYRE